MKAQKVDLLKIRPVKTEVKNALDKKFTGLIHAVELNYRGLKFISILQELGSSQKELIQDRKNALNAFALLNFIQSRCEYNPDMQLVVNPLDRISNSLNTTLLRRTYKARVEMVNSKVIRRQLLSSEGQEIPTMKGMPLDQVKENIKYLWLRSPNGRKSQERAQARATYGRSQYLFGDVSSRKEGGTHTQPGLILRAYQAKMNAILQTNKKPMTQERHLGIELEFLMNRENKLNVENTLRQSEFKKYFSLGNDGSLNSSDTHVGAELRICVPASQLNDCMQFVSKVLKENDSKIDRSCGLHVHLDSRNDSPKTIFENLLSQQKTLFDLVPSSRRDNQYCRYTKRSDYQGSCRYKAVNSRAYNKFKTIEVRLHAGTIDAEKVINWCTLISAIAYDSNEITSSRTVKTMLEKYNFSDSLKQYFLSREEKFRGHGSVNENDFNNEEVA